MNSGVQASPVVNNSGGADNIHLTTNCADGQAYCHYASGNILWSYDPLTAMQQYILQGVVISDGMAFFGDDAGYPFC